ncbi:MAG: hypothetical protein AB2L22_08065 [Syntrophales bacterium]
MIYGENMDLNVANPQAHAMMNVEEVALYFRKSTSWVYKNWKVLGGRKLKGSLFFPSREELYERLFCEKTESVALRIHSERKKVLGKMDEDKRGGAGSRVRAKGEPVKPDASGFNNPNRHGLLDPAQ